MSLPTYPIDLYGDVPNEPSIKPQRQNRPRSIGYGGMKPVINCEHWLHVGTAIALGSLSFCILSGAIAQYSTHLAQTPASAPAIPAPVKAMALSQLP